MPKQPERGDVGRTRAALLAGRDEASYLRVRRTPHAAEDLDGFVVGVGEKWALLQTTRDGGYLDGWNAFRISDVSRIDEQDDSFQRAVGVQQPAWPPTDPIGVALDRTADLLRSVGTEALVGVEQERKRSAVWIGTVEEVEHGRLWLHEIDPQARWHEHQRRYRLGAITRVQLRTEYLNGLASVAPERSR